jgi:acyl dehydratase
LTQEIDRAPVYDWDMAQIGDASPPHVVQATPEFIGEFCNVARYENPVYTSRAAAGESGLPGGVAPPAMILALAPLDLTALASAKGCVLPFVTSTVESGTAATTVQTGTNAAAVDVAASGPSAVSPSKLSIKFKGVMIVPGDEVTSVTTTENKSKDQSGSYICFRVTAHNQKSEPVVEYFQTFSWQ